MELVLGYVEQSIVLELCSIDIGSQTEVLSLKNVLENKYKFVRNYVLEYATKLKIGELK